MKKPRVLITSSYKEECIVDALNRLARYADLIRPGVGRILSKKELVEYVRDADGIFASDEPYDAEVLSAAGNLKFICRDGVGLDNINLEECKKRGIVVMNSPVIHEAVADLAMGLIIAVVRRILIGDRGVRAGQWKNRDNYLSPDVYGSTLGIIGIGRTGIAVTQRASGFKMRIIGYGGKRKSPEEIRKHGIEPVDFDVLLKESDIVSLHVPLTSETEGMIGKNEFKKMRKGSYLINVSRARVVDEVALIEALKSGHLAGAGLDVVAQEPPGEDHPLLRCANVVFTPHVGSDTYNSFRRVAEFAVDNMIAFLTALLPA